MFITEDVLSVFFVPISTEGGWVIDLLGICPEGQISYLPRKEVIHRQVPLAMPCYDLLLITDLTVVPDKSGASGAVSSPELTGGEYKARERIHRGVADPRLLAIPASWRRVAASNPN